MSAKWSAFWCAFSVLCAVLDFAIDPSRLDYALGGFMTACALWWAGDCFYKVKTEGW